MRKIGEMYKDLKPESLEFIVNYKHKGKSADEWLEEARTIQGFDEERNPKWYESTSNSMDAITMAKLILEGIPVNEKD